MSLTTPIAIRTLQRKLYRKAKVEPAFRFYLLYDKIYREDILRHAYAMARANAGAPGVDGQTFAAVEASGLEGWLAGLREELISKTYRPDPVRRMMIPKPGGGERPLGIPTIRDRVVQTAAKLVLEPIFEADFEDSAYGYRPDRGAVDAVKEVHRLICRGHTDVVDADLSRYFDSIPHGELLKSVARRIVDRHVLRLIKLWLKAPIEEGDAGDRSRHIGGGRSNTRGTPQGGVASPLLANIYMNRFLKHWRLTGCGEAFRAHVVAYADDFVILSRGCAAEALAWTKAVMTRLGLTLNEVKTSLKNARQERFDFLGYSFGPHRYCESACKKDPLLGVIGIQSGPPNRRVHIGFHDSWGPDWDVGRGDDCEDSPSVFCTREGDQGDLPGSRCLPEGREEGDPLGLNGVSVPPRGSTSSQDWAMARDAR
jgi:RNA-directed DNA polymerase